MSNESGQGEAIDVAVFTSAPGHSVYKTVSRLLDLPLDLRIHILVHRPPRRIGRLVRNQVRNLRKHGWRWIPYQAAEILSLLFARLRYSRKPVAATGEAYTKHGLLATGKVRIEEFATVNGDAVRAYLGDLPDLQLGLSLAAPILKAGTFEIPALGTLNIHKGKLPDYRGMPPAFWEILAGESEVGVSVHFVEKGLDTGPLVKTATVPIDRFSSPAGLRVNLDERGHDLVCDAVHDVISGHTESIPQKGNGMTNSRPTLKVEWEMARSISRREGTYGAKPLLKNAFLNSYCVARHIGQRIGFFNHFITVLLYHRVSDALRDSVTVGIEQFDAQMAYLADNYDVRSLRTLLHGDMRPVVERPIVCITFDDGYLDNYVNAAPVLLKHGLPATFFVSTDKVSKQTPFEHDLEKLGHGLPNMTWDNIREMVAEGFDFGSHTVNHADLGRVPEQQIFAELIESRKTIEEELGYEHVPFAFPFGRQHNFSERARDIVKEVGYTCCCSAFGGRNTPESWDPFRINRVGINFNFSLAALRAQIHGW